MQMAVENAHDIALWVNQEGDIIYANQSACLALEYSKDELYTMKVFDIDPIFTPKDHYEKWEFNKKMGQISFQSMHKRKDGTTYPVELYSNYIQVGGKEIVYAFIRDISESK